MTDRPPKLALVRRAPGLDVGRVADLWDFGVDAERDFATAQLRLRLRLRLATRGRRAAAICRQRAAAAAAAGRRVAFWALAGLCPGGLPRVSLEPRSGLRASWTDARSLVFQIGRARTVRRKPKIRTRVYAGRWAPGTAVVKYRYVTLYNLGGRAGAWSSWSGGVTACSGLLEEWVA